MVQSPDDPWWSMMNPEIGIFRDYLLSMEAFLEAEARQHNESIDVIDERIRRGEIKPILNDSTQIPAQMDYDFYRLQMLEHFSNILWKSCFVSLYTYLETSLMHRCQWQRQRIGITIDLKDMAKSGLERSMLYLEKVVRIKFSRGTSREWSDIQNYRQLRNCIVHNQGVLDENVEHREKLARYLRNKSTISLDINNEILLSREFCEETIETIERFLFAVDANLSSEET